MENVKKRVLCVDDKVDGCKMLAKFLEIIGYEVISVNNVNDALRITKSEHFAAYVLDNQLPDRTVIKLCKQIRLFDQNTPIIFYTAADQEASCAGTQFCVSKQGNLNELETILLSLFRRNNDKNIA